ncbi:MAG: prepilin peptidase [Chloracidobacterium sp.]|uniref:Prepilin peptidase n=1 Tax=Chloracidobacterium validum TaxID=2821543 RepID=A0ABX8B902_9BACT|nr:A24 family peptidase [Chloracidobacterium validum]QUW03416.1 prepilin peptidase [Chloracidobacterium validum]
MFISIVELHDSIPLWFWAIWFFILGSCIGSFLNVVIYRLPRGGSVNTPARSYCPSCNTTIAWYDNLPLVSFLALGGRCRSCGVRISWQYPLVELATGLLFVGALLYFGLTLQCVLNCAFGAALVALIVTDFNEQILPDAITLPGTALAIAARMVDHNLVGLPWMNLFFEGLVGRPLPMTGLTGSLINVTLGMAIGAGTLWVLGVGYFRLRAFPIRTLEDLTDFLKRRCVVGTLARLKVRRANGKRGAVYILGGDFSTLSPEELAEAEFASSDTGSPELSMTALDGVQVEVGERGVRITSLPDDLESTVDGRLEAGDTIVSGNLEGMGLGDVKMMLFVGAFLGGGMTFFVLLVASLMGVLVALPRLVARGQAALQYAMPFGVMLGIASLVALFFGEKGLTAYLDFISSLIS